MALAQNEERKQHHLLVIKEFVCDGKCKKEIHMHIQNPGVFCMVTGPAI